MFSLVGHCRHLFSSDPPEPLFPETDNLCFPYRSCLVNWENGTDKLAFLLYRRPLDFLPTVWKMTHRPKPTFMAFVSPHSGNNPPPYEVLVHFLVIWEVHLAHLSGKLLKSPTSWGSGSFLYDMASPFGATLWQVVETPYLVRSWSISLWSDKSIWRISLVSCKNPLPREVVVVHFFLFCKVHLAHLFGKLLKSPTSRGRGPFIFDL